MIREIEQESFVVSAPGSVCLLGEELGWLGLRTLHMAIGFRVYVAVEPRPDELFRVELEEEDDVVEFVPLRGLGAEGLDDPLRRAVDLLGREGLEFGRGSTFQIRGDMPSVMGLGRSAARMVAWVTALLQLRGRLEDYSAQRIAALAREAASVEADEPVEETEFLISATGGANVVNHGEGGALTPITRRLDGLIIADVLRDGEAPVDRAALRAIAVEAEGMLQELDPSVDLRTAAEDELFGALNRLPERVACAAYALAVDRGLTEKALELLQADSFDQDAFGELVDSHHEMLRDNLGVAAPRIEQIIEVCKKAGALGCKINADCGRTASVYAPGRVLQVAAAIREAAARPYPVTKTHGVSFEG